MQQFAAKMAEQQWKTNFDRQSSNTCRLIRVSICYWLIIHHLLCTSSIGQIYIRLILIGQYRFLSRKMGQSLLNIAALCHHACMQSLVKKTSFLNHFDIFFRPVLSIHKLDTWKPFIQQNENATRFFFDFAAFVALGERQIKLLDQCKQLATALVMVLPKNWILSLRIKIVWEFELCPH